MLPSPHALQTLIRAAGLNAVGVLQIGAVKVKVEASQGAEGFPAAHQVMVYQGKVRDVPRPLLHPSATYDTVTPCSSPCPPSYAASSPRSAAPHHQLVPSRRHPRWRVLQWNERHHGWAVL